MSEYRENGLLSVASLQIPMRMRQLHAPWMGFSKQYAMEP